MIVYRVENYFGYRPYQLGLSAALQAVGLGKAPLPEMDGMGGSENWENLHFGFPSLPLYCNWFPPCNRNVLTLNNYSLVAFWLPPTARRVMGRRQCAFERWKGVEVARYAPMAVAEAWKGRAALISRSNELARERAGAARGARCGAEATAGSLATASAPAAAGTRTAGVWREMDLVAAAVAGRAEGVA